MRKVLVEAQELFPCLLRLRLVRGKRESFLHSVPHHRGLRVLPPSDGSPCDVRVRCRLGCVIFYEAKFFGPLICTVPVVVRGAVVVLHEVELFRPFCLAS